VAAVSRHSGMRRVIFKLQDNLAYPAWRAADLKTLFQAITPILVLLHDSTTVVDYPVSIRAWWLRKRHFFARTLTHACKVKGEGRGRGLALLFL